MVRKTCPPFEGAALVPDLITGPPVRRTKSLLYIGASKRRQFLLPELAKIGWLIDILEVFPENVGHLRNHRPNGVRMIREGDVRCDPFPQPPYDAAVWWHGPEHVPKEDVPGALARLEEAARLVVLGGPLEDPPYPEGAAPYRNPHERHHWSITVPAIEQFGYTVARVRRPLIAGFVAWKISESKKEPEEKPES